MVEFSLSLVVCVLGLFLNDKCLLNLLIYAKQLLGTVP